LVGKSFVDLLSNREGSARLFQVDENLIRLYRVIGNHFD